MSCIYISLYSSILRFKALFSYGIRLGYNCLRVNDLVQCPSVQGVQRNHALHPLQYIVYLLCGLYSQRFPGIVQEMDVRNQWFQFHDGLYGARDMFNGRCMGVFNSLGKISGKEDIQLNRYRRYSTVAKK